MAGSPWPSFGRDRKNTRRSSYNTSHVDGTEKWNFETGDRVRSSPAISENGTIYVGSLDKHTLYAICSEEDDEDDEMIPGFTSTLLLMAGTTAMAIYRKKKR